MVAPENQIITRVSTRVCGRGIDGNDYAENSPSPVYPYGVCGATWTVSGLTGRV
jgi:hypothetical protein